MHCKLISQTTKFIFVIPNALLGLKVPNNYLNVLIPFLKKSLLTAIINIVKPTHNPNATRHL